MVSILPEWNRKLYELNGEFQLNLRNRIHFETERPAMIQVIDLVQKVSIAFYYCEVSFLLDVT